jgi:hypothetical protein
MMRQVLGPVIAVICLVLAACTSEPPVAGHSFEFDMRQDNQDAEVLDYRYGDSKVPMARNPEYLLREGKSIQQTGIHGFMRRGDSLYVKWRNKDTGRVYEDTVDLRDRLPADITNQTIYFMIHGPQLYVYLISQKRRPDEMPPIGPSASNYRRTTMIYPDQAVTP